MTRYLKFAIIISPIFALVAALSLLSAPVAHAQEPETVCITGTNISVNPSTYLGVNQTAEYGYIVDSANLLGPPDGASTSIYDWDYVSGDGRSTCGYYGLPGVVSTVDETDLITITAAGYERVLYRDGVWTTPDTSPAVVPNGVPGDAIIRDEWFLTTTVPFTGSVGALMLCVYNYNISGGWGHEDIDAITVTVKGQYCYSETIAAPACDTVTDYHFTGTPTDTWALEDAEIISSVLTINPGGIAAQNLVTGTIDDYTTYSAVISVTSSSETEVMVYLHTLTNTVTITQAGLYTTTFNVTDGSAGTAIYALENLGAADVDIDWTCIYTGETATGVCFGPEDGTFNTSNWWFWDDNAEHNPATLSANLPLNNVYPWAYITSTSVTTLPTLPDGKYMVLEFDAVTLNNECSGGLLTIKSREEGITETNTYTAAVTNRRQTYQIDVSDYAGTGIQFLFGNDGGDGQYTDDIDLDNVCVLVSDDPPQTTTTDPGGVSMICNASGWFDCNDIDGILAYLGVDLPAQRAIYAAGVSLWDYEGWVPWIVAAWWVMVATILCFFLVLITSIINLITYFLNNVLNYINWVLVNWPLFVAWLGSWITTLRNSLYYSVEWLRLTAINWLGWLGNAIIEFGEVPWYILLSFATLTGWIFGGFWWLGGLFLPLIAFLLAGGGNVLRSIINYLIENGWNNSLLVVLSALTSSILDVLMWVWNNGLIPVLQTIFAAIMGPVGILFILFPVIFDFIWAVIMWLWVNVFQAVTIPLAFYTGLNNGVQSAAFSSLMACDGTSTNFWCGLFAGLDLLNNIMGATIFYPIVIAGIVLGTIVILYKNVVGIWNFFSDIVSRI